MRYIGQKQALFIASKLRDELIFNMAQAEGNSLTFAETATVISGYSVAGKPMSDLHQVENIRDGWDFVIEHVKNNAFKVDKQTFIDVNAIVAQGENPSVGGFRDKMVVISGTAYMPPQPFLLSSLFREMVEKFEATQNVEASFDLFLDTARNQYFEDGNKRTGQLMMNGVLISRGYAPFTFAPKVDTEFRNQLLRFYETMEKQGMINFIHEQLNEPRYLLMQPELDVNDHPLKT